MPQKHRSEASEKAITAATSSELDLNISEITLVHKNRFVPGFSYSDYRHGRGEEGMVYCVSGLGAFIYKDETILLREGECMLLSQNSEYTVRSNGDEPFIQYTVNFTISNVNAEEGSLFSDILHGKTRYKLSSSASEETEALFGSLLSAWQAKRSGYLLQAKGILYSILHSYLTSARREARNESVYSILRPARMAMDNCLTRSFASAELAELCSVSEAHFRRLWKRHFGVTPTVYHRNKRLLRAKDMLLSGVYTVKSAAKAVGYDDANYFARVFRKTFGLSPTEYMK